MSRAASGRAPAQGRIVARRAAAREFARLRRRGGYGRLGQPTAAGPGAGGPVAGGGPAGEAAR